MKTRYFILGLAVFFLTINACKKKELAKEETTKSKVSGLVLFLIGKATYEGKQLKLGDVVDLEKEVKVSKKSLIDLQIIESKSSFIVRLKDESIFSAASLAKDGQLEFKPKVIQGQALFKVNKLQKNEKISVVTPTMIAGVRGTSFWTIVKSIGNTILRVVAGQVLSRLNVPGLSTLAQMALQGDPIGKVEKLVTETERVLEAGQETTIEKSSVDQVTEEAGIKGIIDDKQLMASAENGTLNPDLVNAKYKEKDGNLNNTIVASVNAVKAIDQASVKKMEEETKELSPLDDEKIHKENVDFKKEVANRISANRSSLMKRVEDVLEKQGETLITKSGEKIYGVIFQELETYVVTTPEGRREFLTSEIKGFSF